MQNVSDVESVRTRDTVRAQRVADSEIYDEEIALASLAEPLGFDSVWTTSHYFSPYQMTGSALQQATFMAGRTRRVDFGTMVVVLPWHHPLHVATEICVLDNMLAGRRLFLGVGQGAFATEFEGFGIAPDEAAERFRESVEIIRLALSRERFSYEGTFFMIPETVIRPRPRNAEQLLADMRAVWSRPRIPRLAEELGLDLLAFGSSRAATYEHRLRPFNERRIAAGLPASRPVLVMFAACTETDDEGWKLMKRHAAEFPAGSGRLASPPPLHLRLPRLVERIIADGFAPAAERQLWGSPKRCLARLTELHRAVRPREIVLAFRFGAMPHATAEKSMRLFAQQVLPVVHSWAE
jgi:alkanesulfonate monooxygenase SsuD/methylene tetrahydromethanopterin reductase-like flavin-dependent oxidoreductase (luciferase family)